MKTSPRVKNNKKLTPKEQAFVRHIVENPKSSATQAALTSYNANYQTARQIASENLTKPHIISELSKYNNLVENTLINTVNDFQQSEKIAERSLAVDTAKYIHDKIHGKATQRTEVRTEGVTLTIDLTSSLADTTE